MIAQHARKQPHDGVGHHQGRRLAAGQHEVADGDLLGGEVVGDALVDVLVVAAQKRQRRLEGEAHGVRVSEEPASGGEQHHRPGRFEGIHRLEERLRFHHHPAATTIRRVVDGTVGVAGEIAQVDDAVFDRPSPRGPARYAGGQRHSEELREDRHEVELHGGIRTRSHRARLRHSSRSPSGSSITSRLPSRSSTHTMSRAKGISTVPDSRATSSMCTGCNS